MSAIDTEIALGLPDQDWCYHCVPTFDPLVVIDNEAGSPQDVIRRELVEESIPEELQAEFGRTVTHLITHLACGHQMLTPEWTERLP